MVIPILETTQLRLRAHELRDFDKCLALWSNPVVTRHIGGQPSTEQQTWARVTSYLGHWALMGFGYWAIEEKSTKQYVGELGYADFKREIVPSIKGVPEMGWALSPVVHGQGYASEAIDAVVKWGAQNLKSERSVCIINPGNKRSIHLAEKFGFNYLQDTVYKSEPVKMYSRLIK